MYNMEYKMDEKDRRILEILREHADYSTRQIAKKTLIPYTTINNRIQKLKKEGVIKKFTIEPDYDKIGRGFLVYILISVDLQFLKQKKTEWLSLHEFMGRKNFLMKWMQEYLSSLRT